MNFKTVVRENLLKKRPNLSEKSLVSYSSTLVNLPKKLDDTPDNVKYFTDHSKQIIAFLKSKPARSRKSVLSPLVVLTDLDIYKKLMQSDIEQYDDLVKKQVKTEKEEKNWVGWEKILLKHEQLKILFNAGLKDVDNLNKKYFNSMNTYVLLSFFVLFPPRRALDYSAMKYQNYDKEKDNYIDVKKKVMVFNQYKTFKKYGKQTFAVPKQLMRIVKQWIKVLSSMKSDYIIDTNNHSTLDITKLLLDIFKPKNVSVNLLRHSFLTHYYANQTGLPDLESMSELADKMSHGVIMAMTYIRKK